MAVVQLVERKRAGRRASVRAATRRRRPGAKLGLVFTLPAVAGLILFQYYPMALAAIESLQAFNPFTHEATGFIGTANYVEIFSDPQFRTALLNTVLYIVLMVAVEIPIALVLANLINQRLPTSAVLRTAVIAALAASETVAILVWNQLYNPGSGLFNAILNTIGIPSQGFTTSTVQALPALVLISVWKDIGLPTLIFLAGLQAVPEELYEAAALDGAGELRQFISITVPLLRRSTAVAVFMSTVAGSRIFTSIFLVTQGGPEDRTTNLIYYAYQHGFQFSAFGAASAATVCMLGVLAFITIVQFVILGERKGP